MTIMRVLACLAGVAVLGCHPSAPAPGAGLAGVVWTLIKLGPDEAPRGAGGKSATLIFSDSGRAGGFAGCNRVAGSFVQRDSTLHFGPLIMTRMACTTGMELETQYAAALGQVTKYHLRRDTLELLGDGGVMAVFAR
jgi:heat shock protein HslJ